MTCNMQVTSRRRSPCPVANALDIVGDKWSLLVIRDLLRGKLTYTDLLVSPEHIPTNLLAERLTRLERAGLITRSPYQRRPVRYGYTLTDKGKALGAVLRAYVDWGKKYIPGTMTLGEVQKARESASEAR